MTVSERFLFAEPIADGIVFMFFDQIVERQRVLSRLQTGRADVVRLVFTALGEFLAGNRRILRKFGIRVESRERFEAARIVRDGGNIGRVRVGLVEVGRACLGLLLLRRDCAERGVPGETFLRVLRLARDEQFRAGVLQSLTFLVGGNPDNKVVRAAPPRFKGVFEQSSDRREQSRVVLPHKKRDAIDADIFRLKAQRLFKFRKIQFGRRDFARNLESGASRERLPVDQRVVEPSKLRKALRMRQQRNRDAPAIVPVGGNARNHFDRAVLRFFVVEKNGEIGDLNRQIALSQLDVEPWKNAAGKSFLFGFCRFKPIKMFKENRQQVARRRLVVKITQNGAVSSFFLIAFQIFIAMFRHEKRQEERKNLLILRIFCDGDRRESMANRLRMNRRRENADRERLISRTTLGFERLLRKFLRFILIRNRLSPQRHVQFHDVLRTQPCFARFFVVESRKEQS